MTRFGVLAFVLTLILILVPACAFSGENGEPASSSDEFIASLEGELIYEGVAAGRPWYALSFAGSGVEERHISAPDPGVFSSDGEWRLILIEDRDTNGDGVVDLLDQASLYMVNEETGVMSRVDLGFSPEICLWGRDDTVVACVFFARDILENDVSSNRIVYLIDPWSGEMLQQLSAEGSSCGVPVWSPDGSLLAFQVGAGTARGLDPEGIRIVDTFSGEVVYDLVASDAGRPAWSPDSTRLAFVAYEAGVYEGDELEDMYRDVFYVDLRDGSPDPVNVTRTARFSEVPSGSVQQGGISVQFPVWSPDGTAIASVWRQGEEQHIWVTSIEGDDWARLTEDAGLWYILIEWRAQE